MTTAPDATLPKTTSRRTKRDALQPLRLGALISWLSGLMLVGLLLGEIRQQTLHPNFLLFLLLALLLAGAVVFALVTGLWRIAKSRPRKPALGWTLLALLPSFLIYLPCNYAQRLQEQRNFPKSPALEFAKMIGASLMEGQAAYLTPARLETERLVMFYDPANVAQPQRDIEAMERHVLRLEQRLGKPLRAKIHWVRGSLLGQEGVSFYGLSLGSAAGPASDLDRHELAHGVITQQEPPGANPPAFLIEGWAESQSGYEPGRLAENARLWRADHRVFHLDQLLSPEWVDKHDGPAYAVGGAIVDFLLRRYGAARFLRLYDTAKPETFDADCRRLLGDDLATLDRLFWKEVRASEE